MLSKLESSLVSKSKVSKDSPVLGEEEEIILSNMKTLKEPMKLLSRYLVSHNPESVSTPFRGTDFKISKDEKFLLFGSRDGRMAKMNLETKIIEEDVNIDESAIWTLEITNDQKYVLTGGHNSVIKKFDVNTFELVSKYIGHTGEVFMILLSNDDRFMYSASGDNTVKMWDLTMPNHFVDIIRHNKEAQAIDLSKDGNFLMSGSLDGQAYILELNGTEYKTVGTITIDQKIFAVKIAPQLSYVITGDHIGNLIAWKFGTWEVLRTFNDSERVWCIDISLDEKFIVTGGSSTNICLWDMVKERKKIELKGHTLSIKTTIITADQKSIISLSSDSKIIKWKIPIFENIEVIHTKYSIDFIWFSDKNALLYAYVQFKDSSSNNKILAWNLINYTLVKEIEMSETGDNYYHKSQDDTLFYVVFREGYQQKIVSYDLFTGVRGKTMDLGSIEVKSICVSDDHTYLFIGQTFKIQTFLLQKNLELYNAQIYHIGVINRIICATSSKYIISADNLNIIKLIDVILMQNMEIKNELEEIKTFKLNNYTINDMKLIQDEILVVISNEFILIWDVEKRLTKKKIKRSANYKLINVSPDLRFMFLQSDNLIEIWAVSDYSYTSFLKFTESIIGFTISPNNRDIATIQGSDLIISASPVSTNKIYICGDPDKKYKFIEYISSIIDDSSEVYVEGFDDWVIEPFHINTLHFYAYYNFDEYLTKAIRDQNAPFFCTAHGHSPLSFALELEYTLCINAIMRELRPKFNENRLIYFSIENCLPALNTSGYEKLHIFYNDIFTQTKNSKLPKFCSNKPSFPIIVQSDSFLPKKEDFTYKVMFDEEGNNINFIQSFVRLPILPGTNESIEFLQSLVDCKNKRIYETRLIQFTLQQKWEKVKYLCMLQAAIYCVFLGLLSAYSIITDSTFLIYPFVFNCIFFIYETSFMISSKSKYFQDPWNFADIIRTIAMIVYSVLVWTGVFGYQQTYLAFLLLISWFRGVSYFRIYKPTRYLINLLIAACKDIAAFLIIIFYSDLSFAIVFYSINALGPDNTGNFFAYATSFYDLNLGNSNTSNFYGLSWVYYVAVTIFNPIIMINLLISILGDTYENVKAAEVVNDAEELISLILEAELLLFSKREIANKYFMHMVDEANPAITSKEDKLKKKIKTVKSKVNKMIEDMNKEEQVIANIQKLLEDRNSSISQVVEKYESKYSTSG
jgi:WD40 repeat protein